MIAPRRNRLEEQRANLTGIIDIGLNECCSTLKIGKEKEIECLLSANK